MTSMVSSQNPESEQFLNIHGIDYIVPWEKMELGHSVFLKTVATPKQVQTLLKPIEARLDIILTARARCEFGFYGVRVWRVS
jgi:hypothetical protein